MGGSGGPWPLPGRAAALTVVTAVLCALGLAVGTAGAGGAGARADVPAPDPCGPAWVTAWQAAAQPAPADPALDGATLRMVVRPQATGSQVRVRLSNAYGSGPLAVGAVSAARSDGGSGLLRGTARPVTFGGRAAVVVPAGADAVSDPVPLVAEAGRPLAVSIFLPVAPEVVTQHPVALQTSYLSRPGDFTLTDPGRAFETTLHSWLVLTGVDVMAPRPVNAVVAVGDSITDGVGGGVDADERWSDALAERLTAAGGATAMAVLNAGISGNRLLGTNPPVTGPPPLRRFDRDVLDAHGATDVVLHIGTNDIARGRGAEEIVAGLRRFAEHARGAGARVFLTTITPSTTGAHGTPAAVAAREAVNAWVRAHGHEHADGVFDFAAAVADPADPGRLAPAYDSGDGLHLSAAGYRALADAVDPALLTGSPCLADTSPARIVVANR
ncbi:GDSL-type esterase/lipase family protein [Pseudonocardia nigra]|uniref:GDSL-type esterase/lipase family protein n=1 Tax=Pseudonocardia nigra TaxID=1921578 RepID=UPI001C5D96AB|nr:GDSL-type esterase/lipase family protein [Pseudonocardia nigra]